MTVKNKTEEPKKDKAEPSVAPSDDLSEEDKRLQEELNMLVDKLLGPDVDQYLPALQMLSNLIRTSTTSMTSVPKPLKFLREHYPALKQVHEKITDRETQKFCADIISVLAMGLSGTSVSKFRTGLATLKDAVCTFCIQEVEEFNVNTYLPTFI